MRATTVAKVRTATCFIGMGAGSWACLVASNNAATPKETEQIEITVYTNTVIRPINPEIYGMSHAGRRHYKELKVPLARWGGNPATRYNWKAGNAWNSARDWYFRNTSYTSKTAAEALPSGAADRFLTDANVAGAEAIITIPTIGWVAKNGDNKIASLSVPITGGDPISPGSEAIAGYSPDANRSRTSTRSTLDENVSAEDTGIVSQTQWIRHLTTKFGAGSHGSPKYYAMDNEPELWATTHTDIHPVRPDYDELYNQFQKSADAVKRVDKNALILGPETWGWTGYFFSARDEGKDRYATHADRLAHGNIPFIPWFLQQVKNHDRLTNKRSLDVLDVHFYPQVDKNTAQDELRMRSTRLLWDPTYVEESWIKARVVLIPRLREWVDTNYPGTKIGLSEWDWGASNRIAGGIATADALGIFGREGLDLACRWGAPAPGTPTFFAFKLFRNADGAGLQFGNESLKTVPTTTPEVTCFSARDHQSNLLTFVLTNRSSRVKHVSINLVGHDSGVFGVYSYSQSNLSKIVKNADIIVNRSVLSYRLEPLSMVLLAEHK